MKKIAVLFLASFIAISFFSGCKTKVEQTPPPPPPPQVKEQPKIEKVEQPPVVEEPKLTEEEIFMQKSLEEINQEMPMRMINFDFDEYFIREDMKPVLENNAAWLKKYKTAKILIEGHCDERGTEQYNLALGEKRAKSAFDYLVSLGIPDSRIKIISYGKSQPLVEGHSEETWATNRRAQFVVIGK